jgi:hypothetical protein
VDAHNRLAFLVSAPTLDRAEWGKDLGLESGFDPVLDRIRYLAENGLTSPMELHDFLSKHLTTLQDRPRPTWMYTGVNDIMRLDRGPGLSMDEDLLDACLKVLTTDQFSAELVSAPAVCEPICMNQAARTVLLAAMPMLDDVDITIVQRGDLPHGVAIARIDVSNGLGDATGGRGGAVVGGRGGGPIGGRGSGAAGSFGSALAPGKGKEKHVRVILDDDKVSSDEDEPSRDGCGRRPLSVGPAVVPSPQPM